MTQRRRGGVALSLKARIRPHRRWEFWQYSVGITHKRRSEKRGFDITGHRYWFNHPWASTDVLLSIRTDLGPEDRGLRQGELPVLWCMPEDYPQRLNEALDRLAFKRSWAPYSN